MNILESLRKIENKIYREQDKSIDLQGMYLKEDVDKDKLCKMINKNDIDGVINLLESDDEDWEEIADDDELYYQDIDEINDWAFVKSKSVKDYDGFWTDYSLWVEIENGKPTTHYVAIFGDNDLYNPENSDWDWEADSAEEAQERFDNYTGFEDEDLDESLNNKELKEDTSNRKQGWFTLDMKNEYFGKSPIYYLCLNPVGSSAIEETITHSKKIYDTIEDGYKYLIEYTPCNKPWKSRTAGVVLSMANIRILDKKQLTNESFNNKELKESKKGTVKQLWDGDTYSYHLYVDGKKVGSFWEFDEVEDFAKNHDIILEESLNKKNLKESVYTENGFKNRKEYLNSLADDYGVDVQTVYDLASVLGPDEDFDALVTELEDVAYSQDDDYDGGTEYVGKQFELTSYYDDKLRGVEDYIELNWGDDPDLEGWIWDKCSQGHYVVLRDWSNGEETKFRPVEEDDIDVKDLIVSKSGLLGTELTVV